LAQRVCGTGIEVILQSADLIKLGKADLALGVGTESMSRNPIAAIRALLDHSGLRLDQIDRFEINEAFGAQVLACKRELIMPG
jgi:acetyl-CoA C-acetyltransferase